MSDSKCYLEGLGYRLIDGEAWYPTWAIKVNDGTWKEPEWFFGACNSVDLETKVVEISNQFPDHMVTLSAMARVRLTAKNGKVIKSRRFDDFFLETDGQEQEVFDDLICADHDGMGNYRKD